MSDDAGTADAAREERPFRLGEGAPRAEWIDYNGHMNVGYYGVAFDRALDSLYDAVDIGAAYVARARMGPFALQTHQHYLRELREGDRYTVDLLVLDCDAKRWRIVMWMTRLADGAVAATSEQISMNVDLVTRRSAPLPPEQAARLEALRRAHASLPRPEQVGAPLGLRRGAAT